MTMPGATPEGLREVVGRADALGVAMSAQIEKDGSVWLADLQRDAGEPGSGGRALDLLCRFADETGAVLALAVVEICEPVVGLYESRGFARIDDPELCDDGYAIM